MVIPDPPTTTSPSIACPNSLCSGRLDGHYEYRYENRYKPNYVVKCLDRLSTCEVCPLNKEFSQQCQQCLDSRLDACTNSLIKNENCPDLPDFCYLKGPNFVGTMVDPTDSLRTLTCENGITVKCEKLCAEICPKTGHEGTVFISSPVSPSQFVLCTYNVDGMMSNQECYECPKNRIFISSSKSCIKPSE